MTQLVLSSTSIMNRLRCPSGNAAVRTRLTCVTLTLGMFAFAMTGCTSENSETGTRIVSSTDGLASAAKDAMAPKRVPVDRSSNEKSPAQMLASKKPAENKIAVTETQAPESRELTAAREETDPAEVCRRFLLLTQAGEKNKAERLLTKAALRTTLAAGLELEPMGGPECTFHVQQASFATTQSKVAQVSCEVVDPGSEPAKVTWMLRKQDVRWRISGLIVESDSGDRDLLSFENPRDVARLAGGNETSEPPARQASAVTAKTIR